MVCDDGGRKRKTVVNIKSQKLILIYLLLIAKKVVCIRLVLALLEAVSCVAGLQWRGAWSDVKTVTGSQPGGGSHSLLHPLSLHHQTSPSYYGQHVSQYMLEYNLLLRSLYFRILRNLKKLQLTKIR